MAASIHFSHRVTMRFVALVLVCLLCHMMLTDCGPIRKKKVKSTSTSTTTSHGMRDYTVNQSPNVNQSLNVIAGVNVDNLQETRTKKDVVHFAHINSAGKQVAPDNVDDAGNEGVAAGNGPVPGVPAPRMSVGDDEKVANGEKVGDGEKVANGEKVGDGEKVANGEEVGNGEKVGIDEKVGNDEMVRDGGKLRDVGKFGDGEKAGDDEKAGNGEKAGDGKKAGEGAKAEDGGKVGQLPPVLVIPESSKLSSMAEGQKPKLVGNGNGKKSREEQEGLAVGVGGMNREKSTTTTPAPVVDREGPDDSLYVGAADRRDSLEGRPKAQSPQGEAPVDDLSDAGQAGGGGDDGSPGNPALQQPPPQQREPPDQFRDKQIQLGPVKPDREAPVLEAPGEQLAPLGNNEIQLKAATMEQPSAAEAAGDDVRQTEDHALKFSKQRGEEQHSEKLNDINPPDHMEGFRMERDGHLNRDYKKEIFLGHHEEFEWTDEEKVSGKLKVIFRRVDLDKDDNIDAKEIETWIMKNVQVHLDDAIKDNAKVFKHLDADKDGFVSWFEFFSHFLVAKGYVQSARNVPKNESAIKLETDDSEHILKYKYRWSDADDSPKDGKLDIPEMMNFRHPEQSKLSIERLITDLIDSVDKNADGIITEEEFIALPHDLAGDDPLPLEKEWQEERKKEFQNVIDLNKDGKADDTELKIYFDPHNANHARLEADNLIRMADLNGDGKLSMEEVLNNMELFVGSKMYDPKRKLHDEF